MADAIYVLGDDKPNNNKEVVFVKNGEDTDLPVGAVFAYSHAMTQFPYLA